MKKGQVQFDYIVAFFIFIIVIFFIAFISFRPISGSTSNLEETRTIRMSNRVSELLIKTKGIPDDWEDDPDNVVRLGLASEPWVLDLNKVNNISSLNYSQIKEALDLDGYQFFLKVESAASYVSVGDMPNNIDHVSMINRYAVLEGETAIVAIGIW